MSVLRRCPLSGWVVFVLGAQTAIVFADPVIAMPLAVALAVLLARAFVAYRRRLAEMTKIAELTQRAILRPLPGELGGLQLAAHTESATAHAMVGGDVHDAALTPAGPRLIIGDVRGGGLGAVRQATAVLAAFRQYAQAEPDLTRLATAVDRSIAGELGPEDFVTVLLAEFAPGEVRLVNCGHPPPLRVGRRLEPLDPPEPSPPLGLAPTPRLQRHRLTPGQRLLLYTDGLTEVRTPSGRRGLRLLQVPVRSALTAPTLPEALERLLELLHEQAGRPTDDMTLLLAQPVAQPCAARSGGAQASVAQTSVEASASTTESTNSRTASGR